jgi:hypothetical protein
MTLGTIPDDAPTVVNGNVVKLEPIAPPAQHDPFAEHVRDVVNSEVSNHGTRHSSIRTDSQLDWSSNPSQPAKTEHCFCKGR